MWIVWKPDDGDLITLWNSKTAALNKLEGALNDAYKGDAESTLKVLCRLDDINKRIREIDEDLKSGPKRSAAFSRKRQRACPKWLASQWAGGTKLVSGRATA